MNSTNPGGTPDTPSGGSNESVAGAAAQPEQPKSKLPVGWLLLLVLGLGVPILVIGLVPFVELVLMWFDDIEYSHGLVVLPLSLYFIALKRDKFVAQPGQASWLGLPLVLLGLLGAIHAVLSPSTVRSNMALVFLVIGVVLTLHGWKRFRVIALPMSFLFFMLPMPAKFRGEIAVTLQLWAADAGSVLLKLMGVPVYRAGSVIQLPQATLEVGQACSGISLLMGFLALGFVFAYLSRRPTWFRALLFLSTIPIALLVNVVRVAGTGLIYQYLSPHLAQGFMHFFEGYALFIAGIVFFFIEYGLLLFLSDQLEINVACVED